MAAEKKEACVQHERGFSLIEVIVALGITLVVLCAALGIFKSTTESSAVVVQAYAVTNDMQAGMNLVRRDLQKAGSTPEFGILLPASGNNLWKGTCLGGNCSFIDNAFTITAADAIPLIGTNDIARQELRGTTGFDTDPDLLWGEGLRYVFDAVTPISVNNNDALTIIYLDDIARNIPARLDNATLIFEDGRLGAVRDGDFILLSYDGNSILQRVSCPNASSPNVSCQLDSASAPNSNINMSVARLGEFIDIGANPTGDVRVTLLRRVTYYLDREPSDENLAWLMRQVNSRPAQRVIPQVARFSLTYETIDITASSGATLSLSGNNATEFFYRTPPPTLSGSEGPRKKMDIRMVNIDLALDSETPMVGARYSVRGDQEARMAVRRISSVDTSAPKIAYERYTYFVQLWGEIANVYECHPSYAGPVCQALHSDVIWGQRDERTRGIGHYMALVDEYRWYMDAYGLDILPMFWHFELEEDITYAHFDADKISFYDGWARELEKSLQDIAWHYYQRELSELAGNGGGVMTIKVRDTIYDVTVEPGASGPEYMNIRVPSNWSPHRWSSETMTRIMDRP